MNRLLLLTMLAASVSLRAELLLDETFDYPEGSLTAVSGGRWKNHSGTAGQANVATGALHLTESESEDVNALLEGGPYAAANTLVLYTAMKIRFTSLPSGGGGYFAHFKDGGNAFRARVFASTNGAAAGQFRLGIAEGANTPALLEFDLSLATTYLVVTRYDIATAASALWVNPAAETDANVTATDDASATAVAAFAFRQSLSSGNGTGTLAVEELRVATSWAGLFESLPELPQITTQPENQTAAAGGSAVFSVGAKGQPPLSYQWQHAGTNLPGATLAKLVLTPVAPDHAGTYRVLVSNAKAATPSAEVTLTITNTTPVGVVTNIAHLRMLVDPVDFAPTDTETLFTVEGIVTTWANLASGADGLFFLQDGTAGVAVFLAGGAGQVPPAGEKVRVTAPLGQYAGLLQLAPVAGNPLHEITSLSTGLPQPSPLVLTAGDLANATVETLEHSLEGRTIRVDGLTASGISAFPASGNITATNAEGDLLTVRINAHTDIGSQPVPAGEFSIVGILGQYDPGAPHDGGYQILPTRFADILSPAKAPTVRFTNYLANLVRPGDALTNNFAEHGLRPGETLRIPITITDPDGRNVTVEPGGGLPPSAAWSWPATSGATLTGEFTMTPTAADAGRLYEVMLCALNGVATSTSVWKVYVPTPAEQRVAITEYLANPTADATKSHFNPLRREPASSNPGLHDEYLELVNLSGENLNLEGWSIADALQVRHRFEAPFTLASSNAVIVFGGPPGDFPPQLDVPTVPANAGSGGLSLNNDGDTIVIRNQLGGIIERLVYSSKMVSSGSAMARIPTINDAFTVQTNAAALAVTPGRRPDGSAWSDFAVAPPGSLGAVTARLDATGRLVLAWTADGNRTCSVFTAMSPDGPWTVVAGALTGGIFSEPVSAAAGARFYRVSSP